MANPIRNHQAVRNQDVHHNQPHPEVPSSSQGVLAFWRKITCRDATAAVQQANGPSNSMRDAVNNEYLPMAASPVQLLPVSQMPTAEAHRAEIIERLTTWVNAAPFGEEADRNRVMQSILAANPILNNDGQIHVCGDLDCSRYTNLTSLPDNLSVGGSLDLSGCTSLTSLPNNLRVGESLYLFDCTSLTSLPNNLSLRGSLYLMGCTSLTSLPNNLRVGRNLDLSGCTSLTSLPDNLSVGGSLNLRGCTSLTSLPDNLSVGETLYLSSCTSLTSLPNNLCVGRTLFLIGCSSLTSLPNNLRVGESLYLNDCSSLNALPDNLHVGGDLDLNDCISLTSLPDWITRLGPIEGGDIRRIDLTGTGLSEDVLSRLRQSDHPGIQFTFGHAAAAFTQHRTLEEAISSWMSPEEARGLSPNHWGLNNFENGALTTFLSRLHTTADAKNARSRPLLQARIVAFLQGMQENINDFRATSMERISQGLSSCDDRVTLIMGNIELLTRINNARIAADPAAALKQLAKSLVALEVVHRHAAVKIASMSFVDPIEVYLAFEIKLKDDLNLPVSTQNMLYERCASLTEQDVETARKEALLTLTDENINAYLDAWEPWQQFERGQAANHLNWNHLTETANTFASDACCVISSEPLANILQPVCIGNALYDLNALLTHWIDKGTNPATGLRLSLDEVQRI